MSLRTRIPTGASQDGSSWARSRTGLHRNPPLTWPGNRGHARRARSRTLLLSPPVPCVAQRIHPPRPLVVPVLAVLVVLVLVERAVLVVVVVVVLVLAVLVLVLVLVELVLVLVVQVELVLELVLVLVLVLVQRQVVLRQRNRI